MVCHPTLYGGNFLPFYHHYGKKKKKITKETRIEKNQVFMVLSWDKNSAIAFVMHPMFMLKLSRNLPESTYTTPSFVYPGFSHRSY